MKTLKDLTPEIQAKIPEYLKRYQAGVFDGGRYKSFKKEDAEALINWNYEECGYKKPVVIVSGNPYEAQLMFNFIVLHKEHFGPLLMLIYSLQNKLPIPKELDASNLYSNLYSNLASNLASNLDSNLRSNLRSNLYSNLYSNLASNLDSNLDSNLASNLRSNLRSNLDSNLASNLASNLDSNLRSNLRSNLYSNLYSNLASNLASNLRSNLDSNLYSNLDSNLRSNLDSNLYSNLASNLASNLRSNLDSNLYSNLDSNLRSNLASNLASNLYSNLRSNLRSNLDSNLYSNLDSNLYSNLRSNLDSNLDSNLRSNLDSNLYSNLRSNLASNLASNLDSNLRSNLYSNLRSNLRSNLKDISKYQSDYLFTSNVYSNALLAWFKFAIDEFKLECNIKVDLDSWNDLYLKSGVYSAIFSELVCIVSKYPKKTYRDNGNRLHNPVGAAVEWESICKQTNFENYYIHGRSLPKWIWDKSLNGKVTRDDFLKEQNDEIKGGLYEVMGQKKVMELLGARIIDERVIKHANGEKEEVKLLKTKEVFKEIDNNPFAWVSVQCPSTGANYLLGVEPHHTNAKQALVSLSMFEESEYSFDFRA